MGVLSSVRVSLSFVSVRSAAREPPQAFLLEVPARRTAEPAHCSLHPGDWSILLYRT